MERSPLPGHADLGRGLHIAIIMDGNGRWAEAQGRPRQAGHETGALNVRRIVEAARAMDVDVLTLFALSSDNWTRPEAEVRSLLGLLSAYLRSEADRMAVADVRLTVVGSRDRLPGRVIRAIRRAEVKTAHCGGLHLRIAVDYSSRRALADAARLCSDGEVTQTAFEEAIGRAIHDPNPLKPVDVLIRTGGEHRLSDFLLWENAYAEFFFTDTPWPEFDGAALRRTLESFHRRDRRFGRIAEPGRERVASAPSLALSTRDTV
jgi:undecaprenyl diphosphate synthase